MTTDELVVIAQELRQLVIRMLESAGSGHTAGSLGMADIFSVLYFSGLFQLDPTNPGEITRDRVIVSNGHICPIWYATLAKRGYFPLEELFTLRQFRTRLQGHPHHDFSSSCLTSNGTPLNIPGIENTAGPLGQGTSFAVGTALGLRQLYEMRRLTRLPFVVCLVGDGELDEGQCWEAFMSAAKFKLHNLIFIIDRNHIQIDGFTRTVMPLEPLKDKLTSFGLRAIDIDGHNHQEIYHTLKTHCDSLAPSLPYCPTALIAHTSPGKGVSFMEGKFEWHGKVPSHPEAQAALEELTHV